MQGARQYGDETEGEEFESRYQPKIGIGIFP
jgi:hypothetical protein